MTAPPPVDEVNVVVTPEPAPVSHAESPKANGSTPVEPIPLAASKPDDEIAR